MHTPFGVRPSGFIIDFDHIHNRFWYHENCFDVNIIADKFSWTNGPIQMIILDRNSNRWPNEVFYFICLSWTKAIFLFFHINLLLAFDMKLMIKLGLEDWNIFLRLSCSWWTFFSNEEIPPIATTIISLSFSFW